MQAKKRWNWRKLIIFLVTFSRLGSASFPVEFEARCRECHWHLVILEFNSETISLFSFLPKLLIIFPLAFICQSNMLPLFAERSLRVDCVSFCRLALLVDNLFLRMYANSTVRCMRRIVEWKYIDEQRPDKFFLFLRKTNNYGKRLVWKSWTIFRPPAILHDSIQSIRKILFKKGKINFAYILIWIKHTPCVFYIEIMLRKYKYIYCSILIFFNNQQLFIFEIFMTNSTVSL